jgi:hypothetical protein
VKGIVHVPCAKPTMKAETREALLAAVAKARGWMDEIRLGRIGSFSQPVEARQPRSGQYFHVRRRGLNCRD